MNIIELKDRIRQAMEQNNLNETRVASMAAEKYPALGIGHQYVRNLLRSNKTAKVDVQKLRAVADVLGICGDVVSERVGPHAQQLSPQIEVLIAGVRALSIHAIDNHRMDSVIGAFVEELTRSVSDVLSVLPQEELQRIRTLSAEIDRKCAAVGAAALKPILHPEQS